MFILGISLMCFAIPIAISLFETVEKVNNNPGIYQFNNGFTEESVTVFGVLAVFVAILGFCLAVYGLKKRFLSSKAKKQLNESSPNFCYNCKVSVSTIDNCCPICGKKLTRRK